MCSAKGSLAHPQCTMLAYLQYASPATNQSHRNYKI